MKKIFLILMFGLFFINSVLGLSCNPTSISKNILVGETPSASSITCSNANTYNVSLYKSGDIFSTTPPTPILISNGFSSTFAVNFNQMNNAGDFSGFLYSSDGTTINVNVNVSQISNPSGIIVFPTSKVINVKQGQTKSQNLQVIVPSNYPSSITIQSVSFNPDISDVIHFGDLDLGLLNPGQTLNIPLIIDANDVQTGIYSTQVNILATNSNGQVTLSPVSLQIIVTIGVTSSTNVNFTKPDCTLSALEFNLNNTYTLTCNNVVNNLNVNVPYNEYLRGISGEYSGGQYIYRFNAVKTGSSTFIATFSYMGSTLFDAFIKDFKVTLSGTSIVGDINLGIQFYQDGIKKSITELNAKDTTIFVYDNKTGNLVSPFKVFVNGLEKNSTITLESNRKYDLRILADGYNDLILENISVTKQQLILTLIPEKSFYIVGDIVNITSNQNDTSIKLDNSIIQSFYTFQNFGVFTLKLEKQGYEPIERNITVNNKIYIEAFSPLISEWKKGKKVIAQLNENASWVVEFQKEIKTNEIISYEPAIVIAEGIGEMIEFKIDDYGKYQIKSGDMEITSEILIEKTNSFYQFWKWVWWGQIIFYVIIIILFYFLFRDTDEIGDSED